MPLIINADDFGYCKQRNLGIIECFTSGHLTHASLMVNGFEAEHAANLAIEHNLPIGLHFNITEGHPVLPAEKVSTLLNTDGKFFGKTKFWSIAINNDLFFNNIHIERELVAQIEKFKDLTGNYPTFINGHNHCHVVNRPMVQTVAQICARWYPSIKSVRVPIQPFCNSHENIKNFSAMTKFKTLLNTPILESEQNTINQDNKQKSSSTSNSGKNDDQSDEEQNNISSKLSAVTHMPCRTKISIYQSNRSDNLNNFHNLVHKCALSSLLEFEKYFSIIPKFLGMDLNGNSLTKSHFQKNLSYYTGKIQPAEVKKSVHVYELMVHPGYVNKNNTGGCDKNGDCPDEFSKSVDREVEMQNLKQMGGFI